MKKSLVIMIISAILASILGLQSDIIKPVIEKTYCLVKPADCSAEKESSDVPEN